MTADARVRKAAQRQGVSKGEWVRKAIEEALAKTNAVRTRWRDSRLSAPPTADIDRMLAEIEAGRSWGCS
jgi:hypothetical protein